MGKLIYGVGYNSGSPYPARPPGGPNYYSRWHGMLARCYGPDQPEKYRGCTVALEWHDFQQFAAWMVESTYMTRNKETLAMDKDIYIRGNKVYGPSTCLLVPTNINNFFVGCEVDRRTHTELAHGIQVSGRDFLTGKVKKLGRYPSLEEARKVWAEYKNKHLHSVVIPWFKYQVVPDYTKDPMANKVVEVLSNYKFE